METPKSNSLGLPSTTRRVRQRQPSGTTDVRQIADEIYRKTGGPSQELKKKYKEYKDRTPLDK